MMKLYCHIGSEGKNVMITACSPEITITQFIGDVEIQWGAMLQSKAALIISHITDGDGYILSHSSLVGDILRDNEHVYVVPVGEKDGIQGGGTETISDDINSMDLHPSRICAFWVKAQRVAAKKLALCSKGTFLAEMQTTDVGVVLSELLHSGDPHVRHIIGVACENIVSSNDGCTFVVTHHSLIDSVIAVLSDSNDLPFISCCLRVVKQIVDASSADLISEKLLSKGIVSIVASLPSRCVKYGATEEVAIVNALCMEILVVITGGRGHDDEYGRSELDSETKEMDPSSYSIYCETKENYYDKCSVGDLLALVTAKDDNVRQYALKLLVQRAASQSFIDAIMIHNAFQTLNDSYSIIEDAGPACSNDLLFIASVFHQAVLYAERDRVRLLLKYGGAPLMVRLALSKNELCGEVMIDCFTLDEIFTIFNYNQLFALVHTPAKAIQQLVVREITTRVMKDDENNIGKYCHKIIRLLGHDDESIQLFASEAVAQLSLKESNKKELIKFGAVKSLINQYIKYDSYDDAINVNKQVVIRFTVKALANIASTVTLDRSVVIAEIYEALPDRLHYSSDPVIATYLELLLTRGRG